MASSTIDIHCHIMPGVDDGSHSEEMSLAMLEIAAGEGTRHMILTPHHKPQHHNVSPVHITDYTARLQEAADAAKIPVQLYTGTELYFYSEALDLLENRQIRTLADSDYLLVEFHPLDPFNRIRNALYDILSIGIKPVIAHVERYAELTNKPEHVDELLDMGCYVQINAATIMGRYGHGLKRFVKNLLKERKVDFIASDAHDTDSRAPRLLKCREYVSRKYGREYADLLFHDNAVRVIKNMQID